MAQVDGVEKGNQAGLLRHLVEGVFRRGQTHRIAAEARGDDRGLGFLQLFRVLRLGGHPPADGGLEGSRNAHAAGVAVALDAAAPKPGFVDLQQILLHQCRQLEIVEQQGQIFGARQDEAERIFVVGIAVPRALAVAAALALGRAVRDLVADAILLVAGRILPDDPVAESRMRRGSEASLRSIVTSACWDASCSLCFATSLPSCALSAPSRRFKSR